MGLIRAMQELPQSSQNNCTVELSCLIDLLLQRFEPVKHKQLSHKANTFCFSHNEYAKSFTGRDMPLRSCAARYRIQSFFFFFLCTGCCCWLSSACHQQVTAPLATAVTTYNHFLGQLAAEPVTNTAKERAIFFGMKSENPCCVQSNIWLTRLQEPSTTVWQHFQPCSNAVAGPL